jgi:hypothetical protein
MLTTRLTATTIALLVVATYGAAPATAQVSWGMTGTSPSTVCVYDRSSTRNCVPIGSLDSTAHTWTPAVPPTGMMLPAGVTGGDQGVGTINVSNGYYINGVLLTAGGGSVTSVGLSAPVPIFTITGSPITGSGTINLGLASQTANTVFSGPASGGAAAPTFRALVSADLSSPVTTLLTAPPPIGSTTPSTGAFTTLSASGAISGNGFINLFANNPAIGSVTPSTGAFTTLSASGAVSGTGFTNRFASPGPIGNTAASTGAFTTLSASSTVSGTGFTNRFASPGPIGNTAASTGAFTTLSASSTVSGAGFDALFTSKFAAPSPIGSTTPNTAVFTTARASVTGAPFKGDFDELHLDTDVLRAWGYIGDGASHPLSGVTAVNGTNTTGFTLGQWQALLPAATALSDELDWAAIQSYANSIGSGGHLTIPLYGHAVINKPISTCLQQVQVQGLGLDTQIRVNANGQNAWNHCQSGTPLSNGVLAFKGFLVYCTAASSCGTAFKLNMPNTGAPTLTMRDVTVLGGAARWATGIDSAGGGYSTYDNVAVTLGSGAISGSCMKFNTTAPFTVIIHVDHSHMFSCATAWDINNDGTNAGIEGVRVMNSDADQVLDVMKITNNIVGYGIPQFMMSNVQASFYHSIYSVGGSGGGVLDLWIKNGWFVQLPPTADSGAVTAGDGIDLGRTQRVMIADNFYQVLPGASAFSMIHAKSTTSFVQIRGNRLYDINGTTLTGNNIYIDSGAYNIDEFDNDFNISTFSPVTNNATSSLSINSQQWIWNVSGGKCDFTGVSRPAHSTWSNRVTCADDLSASTDASSNIAVTYPITFVSTPVPVVSNYSGVCLTAPMIVTVSTTGFTAHIPGCPSTAGQNISYTVRGK